ncbi:MAG: hypothetical protein IPG53_06245 [Ignavibacteriales bacterium]|nr:hypothetical protein [Ignavibacteriales bacterium]
MENVSATGASYDVYAWWTAASNRASDAPYIIKHKFGRDTVKTRSVVERQHLE